MSDQTNTTPAAPGAGDDKKARGRKDPLTDPRCIGDDGEPLPISYPKKAKTGSAERNQQNQLFQNWKEQKREICRDPKCFYPLEAKKLPNGEVMTRETESGVVIVGECSWDPRHMGGEQTYVKPVRSNKPVVHELP